MAAIAGSPNRRLSFMVMTGFLKGIGDFHITSLSWPPPAFSDFAEPSTLQLRIGEGHPADYPELESGVAIHRASEADGCRVIPRGQSD